MAPTIQQPPSRRDRAPAGDAERHASPSAARKALDNPWLMLAMLFSNVFASTIDHFVVRGNVRRRQARYAS